MNIAKQQAIDALNELHISIDYSTYCTIMDGLLEIETIQDRDKELEDLWHQFGDVPMNPETECIEEKFMGWEPGTHREEIWHWFDERYSKGVYFLLYQEAKIFLNKGDDTNGREHNRVGSEAGLQKTGD